jgi:hypothetical protein
MRTVTLSLLALALLAVPAPLAAETLTCTPSKKFYCSPEGCKAVPAKVRVVIDTDKQTYSRCDRNGCDKYDATVNMGGIYLNVLVPGKSVTAKVEFPSLQYLEVASLGLGMYASYGRCKSKEKK